MFVKTSVRIIDINTGQMNQSEWRKNCRTQSATATSNGGDWAKFDCCRARNIFTARIDEEVLAKVVRCFSIIDLPDYTPRRDYGIGRVLSWLRGGISFFGFFSDFFFSLLFCQSSTPPSKKERNNIIAIARSVCCSFFRLSWFRCADVHITFIRRYRYSLCRQVFMSLVWIRLKRMNERIST